MYALPSSTLLNKQIAKKVLFEKFALSPSQRKRINDNIARIDIIARLAPDTLPAIAEGKTLKEIYVLEVTLKTKAYHPDSIKLLLRLIPRRMLLVLGYASEAQLVIAHDGMHVAEWKPKEQIDIPLAGLDIDALWEHWVASVANLAPNNQLTLAQRIQQKRQDEQILKEIALLERQINKEKSLDKQMQLWAEIKKLKDQQFTTKQ